MQTSDLYLRRVHYYETDSMKIAHHANYVKWMEEARTELFRAVGFDWADLERRTGTMIPVLFQSVEYKSFLVFDEPFCVDCKISKFNGVKMELLYTFKSLRDNKIKAKGITKHGFIDANFSPVALQDVSADIYNRLMELHVFFNEHTML